MSFSTQEKHFLNAARVGIILPHNTHSSLAEALQEGQGEITLQTIPQRDKLFFDEQLTAYVVLHVPQCSEEELKVYLSRLDLRVEVWASTDSRPSGRSPPPSASPRDLINTQPVEQNEDPIVLVSQNEDEPGIYLDLIWEVSIVINRPRIRLQDAHVTVVPIALVSPMKNSVLDKAYLEPFQPQGRNLFESLKGARGYENGVPYLPISRLESALPVMPDDSHTFHIQNKPSLPLPTHLAFVSRLRCSKPSIDDATPMLTASLDIEMIPYVNIRGQIEVADAVLQRGKVTSFMDGMLPIDCQSRDCISFLFRLEQGNGEDERQLVGLSAHVDSLTVKIRVKLQLLNECYPEIEMSWSTNIDFVPSVLNTPNTAGATAQLPSGPSNLSIDAQNETQRQSIGISLQPVPRSQDVNLVTVSFSAPIGPVEVGTPFSWQVLIVNRATKPAKLAIIPLPRIPKPTSYVQQYAKRHATRSSVTSLHPSERNATERLQGDIAQAVIDENITYAMQHSGAVPAETDLMSLTPELRIGPLGPGQCHEGEIKLVAFKPGAFTLDAIRVVDLAKEVEQGFPGQSVVMDIRELPDVIVSDTMNNDI